MTNILDRLMDANLSVLAKTFNSTAQEVFYDEKLGRLIHPGEFGSWRESVVRNMLSGFLPESLGIAQGFILSPNNAVSHQCDVIIYSRQHTPIIRTPEQQRFFPIESVVAVGEIKSNLDRTGLRDALGKLVNVKKMRAGLSSGSPSIIRQDPMIGRYSPETFVRDQIGTFIFAQTLLPSPETVFEEIKASTVQQHPSLRTNFVVSVDDYCTTYNSQDGTNTAWMYPIWTGGEEAQLRLSRPQAADTYPHLKLFFRYLLMVVDSATILTPELTHYLLKGGDLETIFDTQPFDSPKAELGDVDPSAAANPVIP